GQRDRGRLDLLGLLVALGGGLGDRLLVGAAFLLGLLGLDRLRLGLPDQRPGGRFLRGGPLLPTTPAAAAFAARARLLPAPPSPARGAPPLGVPAVLGLRLDRLRVRADHVLGLAGLLGDGLALGRRRGRRRGRGGGLVQPQLPGQLVPGVVVVGVRVGHGGWSVYGGSCRGRTVGRTDSIAPRPASTPTRVRGSSPARRSGRRPRPRGRPARPRTRRPGRRPPARRRAGRRVERGTRRPASRRPTPADP